MTDVLNSAPGDIVIDYFILTGSGGGGDITTRLMEYRIYEDIKKPYNILTAEILDVQDILNTFPSLNGTETIQLSFHQLGQRAYVGTFALMEITKTVSLENTRAVLYNITAYSPQMLNLPIVTKSFKNVTGTDAISQLVSQYLKPIKPFVVQDQSMGVIGTDMHPYIVNGTQIFQAIKGIMSRMASTSNDSSAWLFFENQYDLILDSAERLLSGGTPVASYYSRPLGYNFGQNQADQQMIILDIKEVSRVSTTEQIQSQNQTTQTFDTFSMAYKSLNKLASSFSGLGGSPLGKGMSSGSPSTRNFLPQNGAGPPTNLENVAAARKAMAGIMDSQSATVHVMYNTDLTVGLYAAVYTLAPAGDTNTPVPDRISGPLLITEICHRVNTRQEKPQGTTTWKGNKGGLNA